MIVKTKTREGRAEFFLCIEERGGNNGSWKTVEHSVCVGEKLSLSSRKWVEILQASREFRSVPIGNVLQELESYVANHGLSSHLLSGLREAAREARQESRKSVRSERRSQQDEYATALRALGLEPGASDAEVESAFRKAARRHHPDVGGNSARFRALVDARNLLLGRKRGPVETA